MNSSTEGIMFKNAFLTQGSYLAQVRKPRILATEAVKYYSFTPQDIEVFGIIVSER